MHEKRQASTVLPHALTSPGTTKLHGKRLILASASPSRKQILETFGLRPEIVVSGFAEDLSHGAFENLYEYPTATATEKAVTVYIRLVGEDPENPPDLVIGADTIALAHPVPPTHSVDSSADLNAQPEVLEKPRSKPDNLRMLLDLNGKVCEVVTRVTVVYPILTAPGYGVKAKSMAERTLVHFAENARALLEAYADSGEGVGGAGGFTIQGAGGALIAKIDGDYNNVVGFPAASFLRFLDLLVEEEDDFLDV